MIKKLIIIALGFILTVMAFTSCSSGSSLPTEKDNTQLYKDTIQRYFNALIKADTDAFLGSLDPGGLLYPDPGAIEQLYDTESENVLEGEASVDNLSVLEELTDHVQVRAEVFYRIDLHNTGEFKEETNYFTFELTFVDGEWLIYDLTIE
ncbi:MAG: hypothetical protein A2Y58_03955 [Chloroflexi bacterium RBG_13_51_52]|nr:MAG: hypothetical protein A2Y58_03955 [Chloroflexi bacterium RBG_13_51_52]